jgi:hypothetical protein
VPRRCCADSKYPHWLGFRAADLTLAVSQLKNDICRLQEWLHPTLLPSDNVALPTEGTCEWVLRDRTYKAWVNNGFSGILWISGLLGKKHQHARQVLRRRSRDDADILSSKDAGRASWQNSCRPRQATAYQSFTIFELRWTGTPRAQPPSLLSFWRDFFRMRSTTSFPIQNLAESWNRSRLFGVKMKEIAVKFCSSLYGVYCKT